MSLEPKTENKFNVKFPEEFNMPSYLVNKIEKPKYIDGEWVDLALSFFDPIGPSASQIIYDNFLRKVNFTVLIQSLDPIGEVIETWEVLVEKILMVDFGHLDYGSTKLSEPFMILKPSDCKLK